MRRLNMQILGKRIFITSGAGFIGSSLIERLIGENEIVVYDNLARNALQDLPCYQHPNFKVIEGICSIITTEGFDLGQYLIFGLEASVGKSIACAGTSEALSLFEVWVGVPARKLRER
jgi:nucleoside-diphosphate-sugar epimerase